MSTPTDSSKSIDSLLDQLDFEKRKYGDKGEHTSNCSTLVLWYFVLDKRLRNVESPLERRIGSLLSITTSLVSTLPAS